MKLLKSFLLRSYDIISYYGLGEVESHDDRDFVILLNRYIVLCFVIIIFHSFSNIIFLGLTKDSVFLFVFSMILLFCWFSFSNIIRKGYFISAVLVILTAVVTYYSSFCGVESGMYLFYFPLLSCLPVFFSFKKDKISAVFIFVLIIVSLYVSAFTNFTLVEKNPFLGTYAHQLLIINISSILLLVAVNFFFIAEKRADYFFILYRNTLRREQVDDLNKEVIRLRKLLNQEDFSETKIEELIKSLQLNDVIFIQNFEKLFPDFFIELKRLSNVPLTTSDLKFCAMLKLGFSTKQIALYTKSTIKSVESKKYRLRKKIDIPYTDDSKIWISAI